GIGVDNYDGIAYAYLRQADGTYLEIQVISPTGVTASSRDINDTSGLYGMHFGQVVAMDPSGTTLAISAPAVMKDDTRRVGAVFLYNRSGSSYVLDTTLYPPEDYVKEGLLFGYSMSCTLDDVFILGNGGLFTAHRTGGTWGDVVAVPDQADAFHGTQADLAVSGDWLVVASLNL
ncbi:hypothetical protein KIPB_010541, partial [Kipferlia bialata]